MDWLVFLFALELGIVPNSGFIMHETLTEYVYEKAGYVQEEIYFRIESK